MAAALCSKCKRPRIKRGGQWICMNSACSNYLVGQEQHSSPVAKAISKSQ